MFLYMHIYIRNFLWQKEFHVKPRIGATTLDIITPRAWEASDGDKSRIPPIIPYKMGSLLYYKMGSLLYNGVPRFYANTVGDNPAGSLSLDC